MSVSNIRRSPYDKNNPYIMINSDILSIGILTFEDIGYYVSFESNYILWLQIPKESRERIDSAFAYIRRNAT